MHKKDVVNKIASDEKKKPSVGISGAAIQNLTPCIRLTILNKRLSKGWTVAELAAKIGEPPEIIKAFENGSTFPDSNALQKLQNVLEVKLLPI